MATVGSVEFGIKVDATSAVGAVKKFTRALGGNTKQANAATLQLKTFGKTAGAAAASIGSLTAAFTLASSKLLDTAKSSTLLAARVQVLGTVFQTVGKNMGFTATQLDTVERGVRKLGITTQAARQSLTQLLQANIKLSDGLKLTRIAQDAAVIAGIDSSAAFNRLVVSVQRNDVRLLRNLGIVINLNTVYAKFAAQTGRTANTLTAFEKRQLLLNEVMARGKDIAGSYTAAMGDVFKRFTSLTRKFEEASKVFGRQFIPLMEIAVDTTSDFLEAFTEGEFAGTLQALATGITAATVAIAGFGIVATGVLGAFGAHALAVAALGAAAVSAAGVIVGVVTAVGLAIGAVAGTVAFAAAQTSIWRRELVEAGKAGARAGNELASLQASAKVVNSLAEASTTTAEALALMEVEVDNIIVRAPEFEERLRDAAEAGDFSALVEIIDEIPNAMDSTGDSIVNAALEMQTAINDTRQALELMNFTTDEANALIAESVASGKGLGDVLENASKQTNQYTGTVFDLGILLDDMTGGTLNEWFQGWKETGVAIREATNAFAAAEQKIKELRLAEEVAELQTLNESLDATRKAGDQVAKAMAQLQNEQKKTFSKGEKQLLKILDLNKRISTEGAASAEDIKRRGELDNRRLKRDAVLAEIKAKEIKDEEKRAKAILQIAKDLAVKQRALRATTKADLKSLIDQERGLAEITQFGAEQIRESNRALDARAERLRLLALGLGPELLRVQERAAAARAQSVASEDRSSQKIIALIKRRDLALNAQRAKADGEKSAAQVASHQREIDGLNDLISQAREVRRQNRRELLLDEKEANLAVEKERKKAFDKLFEDEKNLLEKQAELRGEVNLNSLDAVTEAAEKQKNALKSTDDFLKKIGRGLKNKVTPGFSSVAGAMDDFTEALGNAQSNAQIDKLNELFPKEVEQRIKTATKGLKKAQDAFKKFQDTTKPKKARDNRIAEQKLFNKLIDQGVPRQVAQNERDKLRFANAKALTAEEGKLKKKKEEQEKINKDLKQFQVDFTSNLKAETEIRRAALTETIDFEKQRLALNKEQTAELNLQLASIRGQRATFAKEQEVDAPAGALVPTAQAPGAVTPEIRKRAAAQNAKAKADDSKQTEEFKSEFTKFRENEEKKVALTGEVAFAITDLLRDASASGERDAGSINRILKQLKEDKRTGDRRLKRKL